MRDHTHFEKYQSFEEESSWMMGGGSKSNKMK